MESWHEDYPHHFFAYCCWSEVSYASAKEPSAFHIPVACIQDSCRPLLELAVNDTYLYRAIGVCTTSYKFGACHRHVMYYLRQFIGLSGGVVGGADRYNDDLVPVLRCVAQLLHCIHRAYQRLYVAKCIAIGAGVVSG